MNRNGQSTEVKNNDSIVIEKSLVGVAVDRNGNKVKNFFLKVNGKDYQIKVTCHTQVKGVKFFVAKDLNAPAFEEMEEQEEASGHSFISEDEAIKDLFS